MRSNLPPCATGCAAAQLALFAAPPAAPPAVPADTFDWDAHDLQASASASWSVSSRLTLRIFALRRTRSL